MQRMLTRPLGSEDARARPPGLGSPSPAGWPFKIYSKVFADVETEPLPPLAVQCDPEQTAFLAGHYTAFLQNRPLGRRVHGLCQLCHHSVLSIMFTPVFVSMIPRSFPC